VPPKPREEREKKEKKSDAIPEKLRDPWGDAKSKKTYTKAEFAEFYGKKDGAKAFAEAVKSYKARTGK